MFGLGIQELIILVFVGFLMVIPIAFVVILLKNNQGRIAGRIEELGAENRELREQIKESKEKQ